jgi:nucleoid DNA-binding protein
MAEPKTKPTGASVAQFLKALDPVRRKECQALVALFTRVTKEQPRMWGSSIVGFGSFHYVYRTGKEGDWPLTGFSPRKASLTLYFMDGFEGREAQLSALGRHSTGKSCLYVKKLEDVSLPVLETLIAQSVKATRARYPA